MPILPDHKLLVGWLVGIGHGFLDLFYPPCCAICGRKAPVPAASVICRDCVAEIAFMQSPLCQRCGRQFDNAGGSEDRHCGDCLRQAPPYDTARSLVFYKPPVTDLLRRLKYRADFSVLRPIKEIIRINRVIWPAEKCDYIVAVPLHSRRLKKRGLNQSQVLAGLAFAVNKEKIVSDLLLRVKYTTSQTGLDGVERRRNLKNAFAVNGSYTVTGKNIWLVDDVFTTGTTVSECAKALKNAGAARVYVWTLARVPFL